MKIISLVIIILLFILLTSSSVSEADLISDVCARDGDPAACEKVLRSDPRSRVANLIGLGKISIEKSEKATRDLIAVAESVETKDNKRYVGQCLDSLGHGVYDINYCKGFLRSGDYDGFLTHAAAGYDAVFFCGDDAFEGKPIPGKLIQAIDFGKTNLMVLVVVGNALVGK